MTVRQRPSRLTRFEFLGSPQFVTALTTTIVGTAAGSYLLEHLIGWGGLVGILSTLLVLAAASAYFRRKLLDWQGILPISLIAFVGWSALSVVWSQYQWATLSSVLYQLVFTFLAVYIALTRDMIQIVRIFGNVLRVLLGASLVLEIFAGLLIDSSIPFLGIKGYLERGGPIQGVTGDSTHLGILALVAGTTFTVELLTKSVRRSTGIPSLAAAIVVLVLTSSNVVIVVAVTVLAAGLILTGVRHVKPAARPAITWLLLFLAAVVVILLGIFRNNILSTLQASDQISTRIGLWREILQFIPINALQGWGWIGRWRTDLPPYLGFFEVQGTDYASAHNAFVDVWLQLGLIGLLVFIGLLGLALVRSWHLAVRQQSVVYLWPALVLVSLIAMAVTESAIIVEFSWLTTVICVVKSANKLSWRLAFERMRPKAIEHEE
jgi:O-antigen ligase